MGFEWKYTAKEEKRPPLFTSCTYKWYAELKGPCPSKSVFISF